MAYVVAFIKQAASAQWINTMKLKLVRTVVVVCALLTGNGAIADHEVIVTPERHSDRTFDRHTNRRSDSHNGSERRRDRRSDLGYRGPYLTTYFGGGFGTGGDEVGRFTDNLSLIHI